MIKAHKIKLGQLGLKRIVSFCELLNSADGAFNVFIGTMEKTIALSVVVTIVVFATIYAVTTLKIKSTRR